MSPGKVVSRLLALLYEQIREEQAIKDLDIRMERVMRTKKFVDEAVRLIIHKR